MKNEIYDITFINAFVLQFKLPNTKDYPEYHYDGGKLLGIKYEGQRLVWCKDMMFCKGKGWFQLNSIAITNEREKYTLYTANVMERSDTSMMILPFNGSTRKELCWSDFLVNAFSFREGFDCNDRIWVLLRVPLTSKASLEYNKVANILRECDEFVEEEFLGTEFQMFTLLIPEDFQVDVDLILQSKYSKISEGAKRRILAFHNIQDNNNKLKLQLYKSPLLKKQIEDSLKVKLHNDVELKSSIDMERETFYDGYIIDDSRYSLTINT